MENGQPLVQDSTMDGMVSRFREARESLLLLVTDKGIAADGPTNLDKAKGPWQDLLGHEGEDVNYNDRLYHEFLQTQFGSDPPLNPNPPLFFSEPNPNTSISNENISTPSTMSPLSDEFDAGEEEKSLKSDLFRVHMKKVELDDGIIKIMCNYCPKTYKTVKSFGYNTYWKHVIRHHLSELVKASNQAQISRHLSKWNIRKRREMCANLQPKKQALTKASNINSPNSWKVVNNLEKKFNEAMELEERYWSQRAKVEWLRNGDQNTDNTIVGFECLHRLKHQKGKLGSMAIKLDMSKAYDRVEWKFLEGIMRRMGFSNRWINLILNCITTISYTIQINGNLHGNIKPSRGLRQGDPLLPLPLLDLCGRAFYFNSESSRVRYSYWIQGRDILKEGMQRRVGNGKSIRIYTDKWLPRPSKFMSVSQPNLGSDETVDKLISPLGRWNSELIKNNFLPDDAKCILQIPIGSGNQSDTLLWHYESNGKFSFRSGYWVGRGLISKPGASCPSAVIYWWKNFWKLNISSEIKIFLWRAVHNWIPTNFNIAKRGVKFYGLCYAFQSGMETTLQAL
ncbi:hypothetical protein Ddye_021814 [Dipteronia dyeriana]|uniref:Reverse transcriptase zinc-binding domain-containing protein n=1 Tax=Dipteronia dyeriana TaxID=168575 RepID=A0AAD9WWL8_9ROSI|nr:hypothetical protein Ddye_021814 [Dipteronia dyeriana]